MRRHILNERQMAIVADMARHASDEHLITVVEAISGQETLGHVELQAVKELTRRYRFMLERPEPKS